jgi:hypothetical protein
MNAAKPVYALLGAPQNIGCLFDEKAGHRPPPEIVSRAFDWMEAYFRSEDFSTSR